VSTTYRRGPRALAWLAALLTLLAACAPAARPAAAPAAPAAAPPANQAAAPAAPASQAAPATKDKVSVRLGWVMKGEYGYLLTGKEAGIFEQHGLDVEIGEGKGSTAALQAVANKQDTFGYSGGASYLLSRSRGMPVKMTALLLQRGPSVLLSYPDNPARTLKDLEGKSVLLAPGEAFHALWPTLAVAANIDRSKVRELNSSVEAKAQLFLQHQADVLPDFITASAFGIEEKARTELVKIYLADLGWDTVSNGIFVHEDTIRDRPELVRRFTAAALEAFDYTADHLDQATDIMVPKLGGDSREVVRRQIEATAGLAHTRRTEGRPTGWSDPQDWQDSLDLMLKGSDLKPEDVKPVDYYFTNDFIPQR
jgi:ABC-type nitrate/sulfonate/bicarbonate transport system substrate-binding protein